MKQKWSDILRIDNALIYSWCVDCIVKEIHLYYSGQCVNACHLLERSTLTYEDAFKECLNVKWKSSLRDASTTIFVPSFKLNTWCDMWGSIMVENHHVTCC